MTLIKYYCIAILIFLCLVSFGSNAVNERIFVVVHQENTDNIDIETIKSIYSDQQYYWDSGLPILIYELPVSSSAREKFANEVLNQSAMSSQRNWSNRFVNNTLKNAVKVKPERLVARFIGVKKNAIGYITESEFEGATNLKVVMIIE